MTSTGKTLRLARLLRGAGGRSASLAFDHGLHLGTAPGATDLRGVVGTAVAARCDGIILSAGGMERTSDLLAVPGGPAVILRLDQTTMWRRGTPSAGKAEDETRPVSSVEEAVRLGADAAICYLFIGQNDLSRETRSMLNAGVAAAESRRWGLPLVIEPMAARGGRLDPFDAATVAMNTRIAVEIGADVVKTDWPGNAKAFAAVVEGAAGVPILIAGGARSGDDQDTLRTVDAILRSGARGVLFGRALFQSPNPLTVMKAVRALIHDEMTLKEALKELPRSKGRK